MFRSFLSVVFDVTSISLDWLNYSGDLVRKALKVSIDDANVNNL